MSRTKDEKNTYDTLKRLTGTYLIDSHSVTLNAHQYAYNEGNQRTNETRTDNSTVAYRYDNIGQLVVADSSTNTEDRGYLYDAAWNLSKRTNNGAVGSFAVDNLNELTNAPTPMGTLKYDGNGNPTNSTRQTYFYDDENRLTQWYSNAVSFTSPQYPDKRTDFFYDGLGRLRKRVDYTWGTPPIEAPSPTNWNAISTTLYVYDGKRVIQERDGVLTPRVSYTRGDDLSGTLEGAGGIGGLLARSAGYSSGNWTSNAFYHADGNGNTTCMANTNQTVVASYRYDPFGNTISKSGSLADANVYRFSSKEIHVNSGMYYYLYRFYDPNLQRWLNRDPLGDQAELLRAIAAHPRILEDRVPGNLYEFNQNNPLGYVDPSGQNVIIVGGISVAGGIIIGTTICYLVPSCRAALEKVARDLIDALSKSKCEPRPKPKPKNDDTITCVLVSYSIDDPEHPGVCTYHCTGKGVDYYEPLPEPPGGCVPSFSFPNR